MPSLDQDEKTIRLLNLVNEYQELTTIYRQHYINGFLNLSRANFQSEKTKFGKDTWDMRNYDACKIVDIIGESGEFNIIDRRLETPKSEADVDTHNTEMVPDTQLKNRKKQKETSNSTEKSDNTSYKDPILQFGVLTPPQLRTSQEDFDRALRLSVQIVNIQRKIVILTSELENI
ncbi:hypothetical protein KGF57_000428 [Candida theae]|uniref:Vacuolar ATPase assembly protein VMA22 n=1 Tax=Candida theae TaxID=1198502 RepID=A0AAD5BIX7_9ASCO|nr:uncharacterized protein KGF57_000428 [Candida theae]KAI5967213.1 hypothetical protein KGF57_000428 [Candida theae]